MLGRVAGLIVIVACLEGVVFAAAPQITAYQTDETLSRLRPCL